MVQKIGDLIQQIGTSKDSKGDKKTLNNVECKECGIVVQEFVQECIAPDFNIWYPYFPVCEPCLHKLENPEDAPPDLSLKEKLVMSFKSKCPPEMLETDPSRLNQDKLNKVLNTKLYKKGLLLHGETGRGKTRMMWLLIRELIVARGMTVEVYASHELKEKMIEAYKNKYSHDSLMSTLLKCDVLCIDDLGKEKMTESWRELFFSVLDKRTLYHKPIVITTNYTSDSYVKLFADGNLSNPIVRRFRDFFIDISI